MFTTAAIPDRSAIRRIMTYVATALALVLLFVLSRESKWQGSTELHTTMEIVATILASLVGVMALVSFYSKKNSTILFIGTGFLGTALLDGYHAVVTSGAFAPYLRSDLPALIPWSWVASRFFLSLLILLSWAVWKWQQNTGDTRAVREGYVYGFVAALTLFSFLFFTFAPLPRAYYPEYMFGRPEEFVPGILFLVALTGYLRKGAWRHDDLEHWLVLALIVSVISQFAFMSLSSDLFDFAFDMAHALKKVTYTLVLTGLLFSMYRTFKGSEEAAAKLEQSEMRLARHIQNTPVGCISWDRNFNCTEWNRSAEEIFGHSAEEAIGRHASQLIVPAEIKAAIDDVFEQLLKQEGGTRSTNENTTKDGRSIFCDWFNTPIVDVSGKVIGVASLVMDITKNKQAESMILQAKEDAEAADRAKSEFLSNMSHEIRTPMTGILGMTEVMMMSSPPGEIRDNISSIHDSGKALMAILNDILDLAKVEAGKVELELIDVNIADLVKSVSSLLEHQAEENDLWLKHNIQDNLPFPWLKADPTRVRQVLTNLINNAIKFSSEGGIEVALSQSALGDGRVETHFAISDTGIGLSKEQMETVFRSFTQADQSTTRIYGGSGLGLSISSQLVGLMGGQIDVESIPGRGSVFWFTVICEKGDVGLVSGITGDGAKLNERLHAAGVEAHILIAEDNKINQLVIGQLLDVFGFSYEIVENGKAALEAVSDRPFDLVLMDINMPVLSGTRATQEIRKLPEGKRNIPIIALTANAMKSDRADYLAAGMDDHIAKPVDPEHLLRVMLQHIGKNQDELTTLETGTRTRV